MSDIVTAIPDFCRQIFEYREYLKQSLLRDLRVKYKRSALGYVWTMLHPLAMMALLSTVFSHIMRIPVKDYAIFVLAGLLTWNYFNSSILMSLGSIRANSRLFSQVPVPKFLFILSINISNFINLLFAIVPLLIIMIIVGRPIHPTVLLFPIALLPLVFFSIALSLIVAALNVFFDDTLHLTEVGMSLLYFLSPILYSAENLPPHIAQYLRFNPLFPPIEAFRGLFYSGTLPQPDLFFLSLLSSALFLLLSLVFFRRVEDKFLYFV